MREPLLQTEFWQSQAGRTLYHHSYIYIPAVHFLKYGLSAPIPYLYGLGNTVFHAMLMNGKALTLTTYFETYPVAQLTGILIIVGAIFYMTRSLLTVPLAFALLLMPLMQIEFEAIQLAPGFNPLRYAGLVLQLTSVVYLFRRPNFWRSLMLLVALAVSLVWNKEFALLGLFCQVLALFMPQLSVSLRSRITAIVVAGTIALVGMYYLNQLSVGYLETIQAGLFGVAVPAIKLNHFIQICMGVVVYSLVLFFISKTHEGNERIARLCLIPIMWLLMIKFIYNASYAHMLYSLSFVFPLSLVFWNWQRQDDTLAWFGLNENQRKSLVGFACVVISLGCLLLAYEYKNAAKRREDMLLTYYEKDTWNQLGESFVSTAPAAPIEDRMKALQDELKPNDRVVFLSPFDHLMSFYGNPEKYCVHFE
ncbi:MAG: hypothetical protein K2Q32_08475, partial [Alphaproteobacteria bacterium]|nr:hypothetical protein [Alphaproteobacteria bacterium]